MKSEEITHNNKEILRKYFRDLKMYDKIGDARIYKIMQHMKTMAEGLDLDLKKMDKENVKIIREKVEDRDIAPATKRDYKVVIKQYFKWLDGGIDALRSKNYPYPECVSWINTTLREKKEKLPANLLVEQDIKELIDAVNHPRDEALISILWESGGRIGEIIDLKLSSIEDHDHGKKIHLSGKTGDRKILLISSIPYLQKWINSHPDSDNPDADLWVNIGNTNFGDKMKYRSILKMLNVAKKEAGISKPVNPHHFRHSRLTHLVAKKGFGEYQLCQFAGWKMGSDQASTYLHLAGVDLDDAIMDAYGIEHKKREKTESVLKPKNCPRCDAKIPPDANFCYNCGQTLDREKHIEGEKAKEILEEAGIDPDKLEGVEISISNLKEIDEDKKPSIRKE